MADSHRRNGLLSHSHTTQDFQGKVDLRTIIGGFNNKIAQKATVHEEHGIGSGLSLSNLTHLVCQRLVSRDSQEAAVGIGEGSRK